MTLPPPPPPPPTMFLEAALPAPLPAVEAVGLLKERFPEQVRKQLRAMQQSANSDVPQPLKGHVRLMMTVDVGTARSVARAALAARWLGPARWRVAALGVWGLGWGGGRGG